jgi:hypothetical protein
LAWLEDCVHRHMFTLSQGKCKSAEHEAILICTWSPFQEETEGTCAQEINIESE